MCPLPVSGTSYDSLVSVDIERWCSNVIKVTLLAQSKIPTRLHRLPIVLRNFDPEYKLVAAGWSKLPDKSQLFFGVLDFKVGQAVFQKFGMNSAPSVLFFPPSDAISSPSSQDRYDFNRKYVDKSNRENAHDIPLKMDRSHQLHS
jgi:hypothetical protein